MKKWGDRPIPEHLGLDLVSRPTLPVTSTMLTTGAAARRVLCRARPLSRLVPPVTRVAERRAVSTISISPFTPLDTFQERHVGPDAREVSQMLQVLGYDSLHAFITDTVPQHIRTDSSVVSNESIPPLSESELLKRATELAAQNKPYRSYIGMGYWNAVVPPVILRNVSVLNPLEFCITEIG
jgi:glycine dehydrogenase